MVACERVCVPQQQKVTSETEVVMDEKRIQKAGERPGALRKTQVEEGGLTSGKELEPAIVGQQTKAEGGKKLTAPQRRLLRQAAMTRPLGEGSS